jgi:hypothetical protein
LLLMAGAKEQNRTQREYESDPSECQLLHFLSLELAASF